MKYTQTYTQESVTIEVSEEHVLSFMKDQAKRFANLKKREPNTPDWDLYNKEQSIKDCLENQASDELGEEANWATKGPIIEIAE